MFRELLRKKQKLTVEECVFVLENETRGILSVNGDEGYPYGMPMNHFYNHSDGCIYFHCGKFGHRIDALRKDPKVSFCVCDKGFRREGEWALNVKSVVVFGKISIIDDNDAIIEICEQLCHKFTDDEEYIQKELQGSLKNTLLLKLVPEHICGKLVNEA